MDYYEKEFGLEENNIVAVALSSRENLFIHPMVDAFQNYSTIILNNF